MKIRRPHEYELWAALFLVLGLSLPAIGIIGVMLQSEGRQHCEAVGGIWHAGSARPYVAGLCVVNGKVK